VIYPDDYWKYKNPDVSVARFMPNTVYEIREAIEKIIADNTKKNRGLRSDSILGVEDRHAVWRELLKQATKEVDIIEKYEREHSGNLENYPFQERHFYDHFQNTLCITCNKTDCREHCNFRNCGKRILWSWDGQVLVKDADYSKWQMGKSKKDDVKKYPSNPDHKPHLLCWKWNEPDYKQQVVTEERKLRLHWRKIW
jgi:hypothetical protein